MLGVNQNTEGDYFINFIPIVAADTFVDNGGDFNTMEIDGESKEVDWSKPKSIEAWLDSPYQGDTSVRNGTRLEAIRAEFNLKYDPSSEHPAGGLGNAGWNMDEDVN